MPLSWRGEPGGWIDGARAVRSPNHDDRPPGAAIELLVVHHISLPPGRFSGDAVERLFTNTLDPAAHPSFAPLRELRVAAHFLVRRRGELVQFVGTDLRAWHAGASSFLGRERCNDFSIGIELEGTDDVPYEAAQYATAAAVIDALLRAYGGLSASRIVGHSDIAPGRKTDPGPSFDWARMRALLA